MRQRNKQSGQALAEMAVALVALLAVMLGVLFISGVGIANIRTLLSARTEAERRSRAANDFSAADGDNIQSWDYRAAVPFTPHDRPVRAGAFSSVADGQVQMQLNNGGYSAGMPGNDYFTFVGLDEMREYKPRNQESNRLRERPAMFVDAAGLRRGVASESEDNFFEGNWNAATRRQFRWSVGRFLGVTVSREELRGWRANQVYFPACPAGK